MPVYVCMYMYCYSKNVFFCNKDYIRLLTTRGRGGFDRMVVGFTITCATTKIVIYNPAHAEVYSMQLYLIKLVSDLR